MTDEDILKVAREVLKYQVADEESAGVITFARRIAAMQREIDAQTCEELFADQIGAIHVASVRCAAAIREQT